MRRPLPNRGPQGMRSSPAWGRAHPTTRLPDAARRPPQRPLLARGRKAKVVTPPCTLCLKLQHSGGQTYPL